MKLTQVRSLVKDTLAGDPHSDRLTRLLCGCAIVLVIVLVALVADLWLRPKSARMESQAARTAQPLSPSVPAPTATTPPSTTGVTPTRGTPPFCIAPSDWGIHVVQEGDTLFSLAQYYGTDVDSLTRVNCLDTATILVDQQLYVPGPLALPTHATSTPSTLAASFPADTAVPGYLITPASEASAEEVPTPDLTGISTERFQANIPNQYLHVVLLGIDMPPNRPTALWRTDAIIVVSIDMEDKTVRLLNLPRDLWVYIPGHGYDRINTAEIWGELMEEGSGPETVKQTIYYNLGIPVHYYAQVDFQGFVEIIDVLGGLDIDVICPLPEMDLEPGMHHMSGKRALKYARARTTASDFDRGRRQSKVLMALWDQALTPGIIPKIPGLWAAMRDNIETDLPLDTIVQLAYVGLQIDPRHIRKQAINHQHVVDWTTPEGAMVLLPREEDIRTLLENFYSPIHLGTQDKVRVEVLNGSQTHEAEQLAAAALRWEGFKVVGLGQADHQAYAQTQVLVYRGNLASGEEVAQQLHVPLTAVQDMTAAPQPSDLPTSTHIRVVLGADYDPCVR